MLTCKHNSDIKGKWWQKPWNWAHNALLQVTKCSCCMLFYHAIQLSTAKTTSRVSVQHWQQLGRGPTPSMTSTSTVIMEIRFINIYQCSQSATKHDWGCLQKTVSAIFQRQELTVIWRYSVFEAYQLLSRQQSSQLETLEVFTRKACCLATNVLQILNITKSTTVTG